MYYLITYNYKGTMKDVAIKCKKEHLSEAIIEEFLSLYSCPKFHTLVHGICMREGYIITDDDNALFNYREIDKVAIK